MCFLPQQHQPQVKLPAVSGSSGHLVVERLPGEPHEPHWPGLVFQEQEQTYEEVMQTYQGLTQDRGQAPRGEPELKPGRKAQKQALRRKVEALRDRRYRVRERRKKEDRKWRKDLQKLRQERARYQAWSHEERLAHRGQHQDWQQRWQSAWEQRRERLRKREKEDQTWRAKKEALRGEPEEEGERTKWLAVLVMVDNCTRQCLGLPLFEAGAKVTAQVVTQALKTLLPPNLKYVISDQGTHFRNQTFRELAHQQDFIWIPIARHRPESNGIAERFVRTLKEGLYDHPWQSTQEVKTLLEQFQPEYNDRPHQGLPIPGLSPNEFAQRIWLL